ncbi:CPK14 [Symbiodinium sp. CCMP2592]|nr:CPK14 [Symbiodinium sp. CCMP2592]
MTACCCPDKVLQLLRSPRGGSRRPSQFLSQAIKRRVLRERAGTQDIHTLLLCPDPARRLSNCYHSAVPLGAGGFGQVFRMEHNLTGEIRAIKLIRKPSELEDLQRILNEVCALLQLDHPNIAKLYEYFEDRKAIYVVTEICTGGNLGDLDPLVDDMDEIRLLFRDVTRAVAYCHSEGIAHRDLKFENCLLTECRGRRTGRMAKVIDFGLANMKRAGSTANTWMNEVVGTLYFLAPEVLKSHNPLYSYGFECDLWSLGVMIFFVLTNEHPFCNSASGPEDAYQRITRGPLRASYLKAAGVSEDAERLVKLLLAKEPLNRLNAQEALSESWLQSPEGLSQGLSDVESESSDSPLGHLPAKADKLKCLLERILSYSKFSRFERALLTVAAHEANGKDVEELTSVFTSLDSSNSGWITRDSFRSALASAGLRIRSPEEDDVLSALDPDMDEKIQYTDWVAATMKPTQITSDKSVEELFSFFDFRGKGQITLEDLSQVLGQEMACHVAIQANADEEGIVSKKSFRAFILNAMTKLELQVQQDHKSRCTVASELPNSEALAPRGRPCIPS